MTRRQLKKKCKKLGILYPYMKKLKPLVAEEIIDAIEETDLNLKEVAKRNELLNKEQ